VVKKIYWKKDFQLGNILTFVSGFPDSQVPVDSMQGLEIGSQQGSNYGGPMDMPDLGPSDLHFDGMENSGMRPAQNEHQDQNQMAAWFDTDL
jgi:hypothetical protein